MNDEVEAAVAALAALGLEDLRSEWRRRYGEAPRLRSADLLRRMLAWRIQEHALGGLDEGVHRLLNGRTIAPSRGPRLQPGMRLVREFRGERHEALILAEGVSYRGGDYASLSEVARTITGVRWNGPRFFGLRGAA